MQINIYKDQLEYAEMFGKPVLYTAQDIPRETVPNGWHCYDLCGTNRDPDMPSTIANHAVWNRIGTVLSPASLKRESTHERKVKGFMQSGEMMDLSAFCQKCGFACPSDPRKYFLRPATTQEKSLFYSRKWEQDAAEGTIGHLRMDFGDGRLHHTWWLHNDDRFNTPEFKAVLQEFMDEMRTLGPLKSESVMHRWCCRYPGAELERDRFGFIAETENYRFCLRCSPFSDDYSYLYCYDLNQQRMAMAAEKPTEEKPQYGLTETGLQMLRDTADPGFPHSYDWYVMEACNTAYAAFNDGLSLDKAIQRYMASAEDDKRLGVTKDDVAAVDLVIRHDGREWVSEDWAKSESFAQDPVISEAVALIRQTLDEQAAGQGMAMGGMI